MHNTLQHWVPRAYLSPWRDQSLRDSFIWVFSKEQREGKKRSPKQTFRERDMYTITQPDGTRDLQLEGALDDLETKFGQLYRHKLSQELPLTAEEHLSLCAFVAAMHARSQRQRDHIQSQLSPVVERANELRTLMQGKNPIERREFARQQGSFLPSSGPVFSHAEVTAAAEQPLQHLLPTMVSAMSPLLHGMDLAIFSTDDPLGFVTSDAPCFLHDTELDDRPFPLQVLGFGYESVTVILPISPRQTLYFNRGGVRGYHELPPDMIDGFNGLIVLNSNQHFVVQRNETRSSWYDFITPAGTPTTPRDDAS